MRKDSTAKGSRADRSGQGEGQRTMPVQTLDAEAGLRFLIGKLRRATGAGFADHVIVAQVLDAMEHLIQAAQTNARPLVEAALTAVERADDMLGEELDKNRRRTVAVLLRLNSPAGRGIGR